MWSITEVKKEISVGGVTGLRMVLHQLLQLQLLPLLVVLGGEPPLEAQPTHAHTVQHHPHPAVSLKLKLNLTETNLCYLPQTGCLGHPIQAV